MGQLGPLGAECEHSATSDQMAGCVQTDTSFLIYSASRGFDLPVVILENWSGHWKH